MNGVQEVLGSNPSDPPRLFWRCREARFANALQTFILRTPSARLWRRPDTFEEIMRCRKLLTMDELHQLNDIATGGAQ
jgi:hypothetical protein